MMVAAIGNDKALLGLLLLAVIGTVRAKTSPTANTKPNIVFILIDDLGWNDIGFHGSLQIPTPNIDSLAYSGVILNNYYVSPICSPSRSALMSGKHPIHTGLQHGVIAANCAYGLPLEETILPAHLKTQGYATGMVGKWHIGFFRKEYTPTYRGFDQFYGLYTGMAGHYSHMHAQGGMHGYDIRNKMEVDRSVVGNYSTDLFSDVAVNMIKAHDTDKPLFLYLPHQTVHIPHQAPQDYIDKFSYIEDKKRRTLAAMISVLDDGIGRVVSALHEKEMSDNTIIVFSTDNGGPAGASSNWPLRGLKGSLWEGGVHGAGFIWSPLINKNKRVSTQLMHIQDWMPTLYSAAGGDVKDLGDIDGVDLWDALSNDSESPRFELLHNIDDEMPYAALRYGDYKIIQGDKKQDGWYGVSGRNESSITTSRMTANENMWRDSAVYKIVNDLGLSLSLADIEQGARSAEILCEQPIPVNASTSCDPEAAPCLFNIKDDPCEYNNLATTEPDVLQILVQKMLAYNRTAVAPIHTPMDPDSNPNHFDGVWTSWME